MGDIKKHHFRTELEAQQKIVELRKLGKTFQLYYVVRWLE